MRAHLKRISSPKTWPIERKGTVFVTRPLPGKKLQYSISLNLALQKLGYAQNSKEAKSILNAGQVLLDGKKATDYRRMVGLMDVLSLPSADKYYRLLMVQSGKLDFVEIDKKEASFKPVKITNKTTITGKKLQLNTFDSRSIEITEDNYKVNDSVKLKLPEQKIEDTYKFEKGNVVYLIGGSYVGRSGVLKEVEGNKIYVEIEGQVQETSKKYAYMVGKNKPAITLTNSKE